MKKLIFALVLAAMPAPAFAATDLSWAYPEAPPTIKPPANQLFTVPGSDRKFNFTQLESHFSPADWRPGEHPPMPAIVAVGRGPNVWACSLCHLPNGQGHPESASVAGLPYQYIVDQMHFFHQDLRVNNLSPFMKKMASDITEGELDQAARYFSSLKPKKYVRVVETNAAPASHIGNHGSRFFDKGSKATVPVDLMTIYEVAENDGANFRDDHVGYVDFVPMGSVAKGRVVAMGNRGAFKACASCHGDDYRGHGNVPRLAGRAAYYLVRQLNDMKTGGRHGAARGNTKDGNMEQVIGKLSNQDVVNVAAFMASREP